MPLFSISTRKAVNTSGIAYKWSNRYFSVANTADQALQFGLNYWNVAERTFHNQLAYCYQIYVNNVEDAPNTPGQVANVPIQDQRGFRAATALSINNLLPAWNVVRVDFAVQGSRPSRKFYRIPLLESDITFAQIDADLLGDILNGCNTLAVAAEMRDVDGEAFTGDLGTIALTSRRLGREASFNVPSAPAFG